MTAPDFDAMGDEELAASAAGCMGWKYIDYRDPYYRAPNGDCVSFVNWRPAEDLNDAAKLCAAFLAAWPDAGIGFSNVRYVGEAVWSVMVAFGNDDDLVRGVSKCEHASEARCRTVAVLKAWHELDAAKNEPR